MASSVEVPNCRLYKYDAGQVANEAIGGLKFCKGTGRSLSRVMSFAAQPRQALRVNITSRGGAFTDSSVMQRDCTAGDGEPEPDAAGQRRWPPCAGRSTAIGLFAV